VEFEIVVFTFGRLDLMKYPDARVEETPVFFSKPKPDLSFNRQRPELGQNVSISSQRLQHRLAVKF
jgi:hypothetical protein